MIQVSGVAVLTGAAGGLGGALLDELLKREYRTFAVVRGVEQERQLFERNPELIVPIRCDLSEDSAESVVRSTLRLHTSTVDLLINCAGGGATKFGIEELDLSELMKVLNVHCFGSIRMSKACLPFLKTAKGTILNISSRYGSVAWVARNEVPNAESTYSYRIAKAALNMLTACLSSELESSGVRALSIDPGKLKTKFAPKDADKTPQTAAAEILDTLEKRRAETGLFINASGEQIPW